MEQATLELAVPEDAAPVQPGEGQPVSAPAAEAPARKRPAPKPSAAKTSRKRAGQPKQPVEEPVEPKQPEQPLLTEQIFIYYDICEEYPASIFVCLRKLYAYMTDCFFFLQDGVKAVHSKSVNTRPR